MAATIKIPTVFTAQDKFTATVRTMTANLSSFQKQAAGLEGVNRHLNKFKYHAVAGAAALGGAVNEAASFEASMSNVATLVDTNVESMDKMSASVLAMSKRLPVPLAELSSSLYNIRSAGISADSAMQALETSAKLSAAGLATTEEATNILTSAMNAFASEGLTSDQIANTLFKTVKAGKTTISELAMSFGSTAPIVQAAGVTLADFQAATAAITTLGTPASQAQNQIRAAIVSLQKPSAEMAKIFTRLGVASEKELIKREGSLVGAFQAVDAAGRAMGLNLTKAYGSVEASSATLSLLGATNSTYTKTLDAMRDGTNQMGEAFDKQMGTTAAQLQLAKNNMQALAITVGTQLAPVINDLVGVVTPLISKIGDFIGQNRWLVGLVPKVVAAFILFKGALIATRGLMFINSAYMGLMAFQAGAMSMAMKGNAVAIGIYNFATKAAAAGQWLLNAAMNANPVGLLVLGIMALVGVVILIIKKYDEWGAALSMVLGPLGLIINLIQSFRRHWDSIVEAFQTEGIIGGLKRIGAVILDAILMPMEQFLGMLAKIPGVGKFVKPALATVGLIRSKLDLNTPESTNEVVPTPQERATEISQTNTTNNTLDVNFNDPFGMVKDVNQTGPVPIPIRLTPTQGQR